MPQQYVLWDLEYTLFCHLFSHSRSDHLPSYLTKATIKGHEKLIFHFIHKQTTAQIFKAMLAHGINIGFLTASQFDQKIVKEFLADHYEISKDSLAPCIYIGANDFGGRYTDKGIKIKAAQSVGLIPMDAQITLIDDDEVHLESARRHGYNAIQSHGQPDPRSTHGRLLVGNDKYLKQIIKTFDLNLVYNSSGELLFTTQVLGRSSIASSTSTDDTALTISPVTNLPLLADNQLLNMIEEGDEYDDECCTFLPKFLRCRSVFT